MSGLILLALLCNEQINIPEKCRINNTNGNCGYCAIETVARYYKIKRINGLAKRNKGRAIHGHLGMLTCLFILKLKFFTICDKDNTEFIIQNLKRGRPVIVHGQRHLSILVHYNKNYVKIVEGSQTFKWSTDKFKKWWSGRAYVIYE